MSDKLLIESLKSRHQALRAEISKVVVGQTDIVDTILMAIYTGGHSLLIGVPGLAKTLIINTIARALMLDFKRIQFTPDLMPGDILGSEMLESSKEFRFIKGPVFTNIVLADEINRTPPKTQSALLEAMQERIVTISGQRHKLPEPFFVLATQNPIEQEGTYPLPEAQLDRFMFSLELKYPSFDEEIEVVKNTTSDRHPSLSAIFSDIEILNIRQAILKIPVSDNVVEYAVSIVHKSRPDSPIATEMTKHYVDWGAGPRASQNLILTAKAHAAIHGKISPDKENVRAVAHNILRHRIIKNYKAEAEGISVDNLIDRLL